MVTPRTLAARCLPTTIRVTSRADRLTTTGVEVAGVSTCSAASGAPVDCAADPLSRALLTPTVPLSPSATYDVTLNREHTLHVVDLAGNPLVGTETAVRVQR